MEPDADSEQRPVGMIHPVQLETEPILQFADDIAAMLCHSCNLQEDVSLAKGD